MGVTFCWVDSRGPLRALGLWGGGTVCMWERVYTAHSYDTSGSVPVWSLGVMNVILGFQLLSAGLWGSRRVKGP